MDQVLRIGLFDPGLAQELHQVPIGVGEPDDRSAYGYPPTARRRRPVHHRYVSVHDPSLTPDPSARILTPVMMPNP